MADVEFTDDQVWAAIDAQRLRTADLLSELKRSDWDCPSLCFGWTVRDVAAHLTLQQLTIGDVLRLALRHPGVLGGVNRVIRESARRRAGMPTDEMIAAIRAMVGSRRHNIGVTPAETLVDILVHGQDIAIPLGRDLEMPTEASAFAATRVWSTVSGRWRVPYRGDGKSRVFRRVPSEEFRFRATDIDWAVGSGPEVTGPIDAILLLLTGRRAALPRLGGPGIDELRRRAAVA
ncbi:maleylpyruvate isomerase family mycothiol-dependent enzyme [Rhodococcus sp. NPDC003318]|uniref:maleylpyruvate isomerase family mycothiol-dependent enzyme n=1 Tax=Rhodococcus sp. NPDC003318 TaxID=3364503 RepID=UPI00368E3956